MSSPNGSRKAAQQPRNEGTAAPSRVVAAGSEKGSEMYWQRELTGPADGPEDMEMG